VTDSGSVVGLRENLARAAYVHRWVGSDFVRNTSKCNCGEVLDGTEIEAVFAFHRADAALLVVREYVEANFDAMMEALDGELWALTGRTSEERDAIARNALADALVVCGLLKEADE